MTDLILAGVSAVTGTPPAEWIPLALTGGYSLAVLALVVGCVVAVVEARRR